MAWFAWFMAPAATAQPGPTPVMAAQSELRELPASITLVGTVHPVTRSVLGAEVAGLVREMPARQGSVIAKGEVIARLDTEIMELDLARSMGRLSALQAKLEELEAGTRKADLRRLQAAVDAAKAMASKWAFEKTRIENLRQERQANEKEVNDATADWKRYEAMADQAEAELQLGVEGPRAEQIQQARFDLAEQKAVVDRMKSDVAKAAVRAPFDGVVVTLHTEVGQWINRGDPVVEFLDLSSVLVRVDVPEASIPYVHTGDSAKVKIEALGEVFDGVVKHVIPQADPAARNFPVDVEVGNGDGRLRSGMFARVTLIGGAQGTVTAVPKDAVVRRHGVDYVSMVVPGERGGQMAMPTPVTTGVDIENWVEITSGNVPPGATVVTRGNERLMFPMPVQVINPPENATPAAGAPSPGRSAASPEQPS